MFALRSVLRTLEQVMTERSEWSQGIARILITGIFTAWFLIDVRPAVFIGLAELIIASMWLAWIRLVPVVRYRPAAGCIMDNIAISTVLFVIGAHHPSVMALYFWVVIGSGYRFSSSHALLSIFAAVVTFWISVLASTSWNSYLMAAGEFTAGFVLVSLFAYKLISNLEAAVKDAVSQEQRVRHLETKNKRDSLTGLYNRETLYEILNKAAMDGIRVGVVFIDLDNFKSVNDKHGHHVGDNVLVVVSDRLKASVRAGDVVCRYAGDEFVVIVNADNKNDINMVAERIIASMNVSINTKDVSGLFVTGSLGIAVLGINGQTTTEVLRNADSAMYAAKRLGRNRVAWFEEMTHEIV